MVLQCGEGPLISEVALRYVLVLDEVLALFVNAIVRQVSVHIGLYAIKVVGLAREAHESLVVDVDLQGIEICNEHIESQVEFQAVDKERVLYVPADDQRFILGDLRDVVDHEDALPLRAGLGLDDPQILYVVMAILDLLLPRGECLLKFRELIWENVGLWQEIKVIFAELLLHLTNVEAQPILAGQL